MNKGIEPYFIVKEGASAEIKIKGSRFIAEAFPVSTALEAEAILADVKKKGYDATHHCSAYKIGADGLIFRYSDDGEPNSSAGLPIFRQIEGHEFTNVLVVVTRYYGGTKLGTGGLVRAYGDAAGLALDASSREEVIPRTEVVIEFDYDDTSPAMHTVSQFDVVVRDTHYTELTRMHLDVRTSEVEQFIALFVEALSGRGSCALLGDNE